LRSFTPTFLAWAILDFESDGAGLYGVILVHHMVSSKVGGIFNPGNPFSSRTVIGFLVGAVLLELVASHWTVSCPFNNTKNALPPSPHRPDRRGVDSRSSTQWPVMGR